jgi:hypothetical protein
MDGDGTAGRLASEVPPATATKALGWSGRDGRATPPALGPGAREDASRRFGRGRVDERFVGTTDPLRDIPDHNEVDHEAVLADAKVEAVLADLDRDLVALRTVKQCVREIASLLVIDRLRRSIGLESDRPTLHMCFTGNPGTGKTTVAKRMGEILLEVMENQREDLVVIMAGYKKEMDRFFSDVPGLSSRVAHYIDFPDYSAEELTEIARRMLQQQRYRFADDAESAFQEYLELRIKQPRFANGRSVRNWLDRVRMRHAMRLFEAASEGRRLTKRDLVTIAAEDVRKSRVFQAGSWGDVPC